MDAAGSLSEIMAPLYQTISPVLSKTIVISIFTTKNFIGRMFQTVDLSTFFLSTQSPVWQYSFSCLMCGHE